MKMQVSREEDIQEKDYLDTYFHPALKARSDDRSNCIIRRSEDIKTDYLKLFKVRFSFRVRVFKDTVVQPKC